MSKPKRIARMTKAVATVQPLPLDAPRDILQVIARAAADPNVDTDKMQALLTMRREEEDRAAEEAFNEAMNIVQSKVASVAADANNPQTRSKYASYYALDRAIRPSYTAEGFGVSFDTDKSDRGPDWIEVICTVTRGRHKRTHSIPMPIVTKGIKGADMMTLTHAVASATQYGKRYTLGMAFNISTGRDDDGNAAAGFPVSTETISEEDQDWLNKEITDTKTDYIKFLQYLSSKFGRDIMVISDIRVSELARAKEALANKRRVN